MLSKLKTVFSSKGKTSSIEPCIDCEHRRKDSPSINLNSNQFPSHHHLNSSIDLLQSTVCDIIKTANSTAISVTEQLERTENRLYSLIDAIEDVVVIKDSNNRWITANKAAQKVFQFYKHEYLGKTNTELIETHPYLNHFQSFHLENEDEAWNSRKPIRFLEVYNNGLEEQYFDVIKTPSFFKNGERKEMIIIGRDVTPEYLEQQKTRACFIALNTSSDAIVILDRDYKVFFANFKFLSLFDKKDVIHTIGSANYIPVELTSIIENFDEYYHMMISLQQNMVWRSCWDRYEIIAMPIMNGTPEPIFHIITFKTVK